ncbi:hypothetical protein CAEBREN_18904 [Caenorhabditis brenneri]|uniref:Uncharacterized protein n=1 Tax=Caenorhabditis brenneri TaxID=135651 RepID=G0N607_CAEBE|nr:hypothetical protein CAEBREN_18904 [Caenorhabditis brenneri]
MNNNLFNQVPNTGLNSTAEHVLGNLPLADNNWVPVQTGVAQAPLAVITDGNEDQSSSDTAPSDPFVHRNPSRQTSPGDSHPTAPPDHSGNFTNPSDGFQMAEASNQAPEQAFNPRLATFLDGIMANTSIPDQYSASNWKNVKAIEFYKSRHETPTDHERRQIDPEHNEHQNGDAPSRKRVLLKNEDEDQQKMLRQDHRPQVQTSFTDQAFTSTSSQPTHSLNAVLRLDLHYGNASQMREANSEMTAQNLGATGPLSQSHAAFGGVSFHGSANQSGSEQQEFNAISKEFNATTPPTQSVMDNDEQLGLEDLDWEYPEGACNFESYSNYVDQIDPWKEIEAVRAQTSSISAREFLQMGNNQEDSSSQEAGVLQTPRATRKLATLENLGLTEEGKKEKADERATNRKYQAKCSQKKKETRESYEKEAELLLNKINGPRQYRKNIEKNMLVIGKMLEKWFPGFLWPETKGYIDGRLRLREKFAGQKNLDSDLTEADKKLSELKQKLQEATRKSVTDKSPTVASQKSRANVEVKHSENVYNVLNSKWALLSETKLVSLAQLYLRRTLPTVITKIKPILMEVRNQCKQNGQEQEFNDFIKFLKENRHLVQKKTAPVDRRGF